MDYISLCDYPAFLRPRHYYCPMQTMSKGLLLLFFGVLGTGLLAQSSIEALESDLAKQYEAIRNATSDEDKMAASDAFKSNLKSTLFKAGAMSYPFEQLNLCKLVSPDGHFRLFNWNIPMADGTHRYEALVLIPKSNKDDSMVDVAELNAVLDEPDRLESRTFKNNEWMGFLVYDIIPNTKQGQYLLLAWDGHDRTRNRKIIDVMTLNGKNVRMGAPVFKGNGNSRRIIFTYAEDLTMSLIYDKKDRLIIFDHLAPSSPRLEGQYQFYGPDMSFDAYVFSKGNWTFESNVEFLRKRTDKDRNFNDPRIK